MKWWVQPDCASWSQDQRVKATAANIKPHFGEHQSSQGLQNTKSLASGCNQVNREEWLQLLWKHSLQSWISFTTYAWFQILMCIGQLLCSNSFEWTKSKTPTHWNRWVFYLVNIYKCSQNLHCSVCSTDHMANACLFFSSWIWKPTIFSTALFYIYCCHWTAVHGFKTQTFNGAVSTAVCTTTKTLLIQLELFAMSSWCSSICFSASNSLKCWITEISQKKKIQQQ